jgi:hypothetical protein
MTEPLIVVMFRTQIQKVLADFNDPEMLHWALTVIEELPYSDNEAYAAAAKETAERICRRLGAKRAVQQAQVEAFLEMQTTGVH